ncbi:hypothetical protein AB0J56_47980, partial [Actinoplanes xinjiangensis]
MLVLPPRGPAVCPWLTSINDDGTRALVGWAIALTPHTGTVLTALRMALVVDEQRGPFGAVPAMVRVDGGLEFAAQAVKDALAALCVESHRLPGFTPDRKGKIERIHQSMEQTLLMGMPGYTKGPRDAGGRRGRKSGMSQDNLIDDVVSEFSRAFAKVINASSEFATAMIELRIQRLREAARRAEEQARAVREQTRMQHQADSALWRAAMRPQWWRDAGAEDIGRVWRAASTWQHVDPRAAEARQVVVDRLADRGVHVDPQAPTQPSPEDVAWLAGELAIAPGTV